MSVNAGMSTSCFYTSVFSQWVYVAHLFFMPEYLQDCSEEAQHIGDIDGVAIRVSPDHLCPQEYPVPPPVAVSFSHVQIEKQVLMNRR